MNKLRTVVSHLIHISHSKWIFWNFTLHDRTNGYLCLTAKGGTAGDRENSINESQEAPYRELIPAGNRFR